MANNINDQIVEAVHQGLVISFIPDPDGIKICLRRHKDPKVYKDFVTDEADLLHIVLRKLMR